MHPWFAFFKCGIGSKLILAGAVKPTLVFQAVCGQLATPYTTSIQGDHLLIIGLSF